MNNNNYYIIMCMYMPLCMSMSMYVQYMCAGLHVCVLCMLSSFHHHIDNNNYSIIYIYIYIYIIKKKLNLHLCMHKIIIGTCILCTVHVHTHAMCVVHLYMYIPMCVHLYHAQ